MTTRRWLMRLLPAALLPMAVKGQDGVSFITISPPRVPDEISLYGATWVIPQWLKTGKPKNNQCPVCGTMAPPYKRGQAYCDGAECFPADSRRIDCALCNATFLQRAE